uniref:Uncharacterized protein n=1 Tax=viral metagenome TaxID=1070528 RepID=A0A6M3JNS2_9ZZZZ
MLVRILTQWTGAPPCGAVVELPDSFARQQIQAGHVEPAGGPPSRETTSMEPGEQAIKPRGRPRKPR